jgi:hypothetical protein
VNKAAASFGSKAASVGGLFVCVVCLIGQNFLIDFQLLNQVA